MRRSVSPVFLAGLFLPLVLTAAGQQFQPKSIQFKGDSEYSDGELMDAAGLKPGTVLTSAEMDDHSKRLMDTGVFDNLTYKFDGRDLVYSLKPAQLYPIRLENLPLPLGADLDATLHGLLPLYHGKVPAEGTLLDNVRKHLEDMLAKQGITATLLAVPFSDRKTAPKKGAVTAISFSIDKPPVMVGAIRVQGASPDFQPRLEPIVKGASEQAFDSSNSAANVEDAFRTFYEDQGYAAVKITAERSGAPVISEASILVPFSVTIEEGRQYKLGDIQFPPGTPIEKADVDKLLTKPGASPTRGIGLRSVWALVAQRYRSKGYMDVIVSPHAQIDEAAGVVNYSVDVNPGAVYHLALIKFDNVSDDLRKLLMHNWQLMPGDPFDQTYVSTFLLKQQLEDPVLRRTLAGVKAKFDVMADPQTHDVNLVIRLEKVP